MDLSKLQALIMDHPFLFILVVIGALISYIQATYVALDKYRSRKKK